MKRISMLVMLVAALLIGACARSNACNCPHKGSGEKGGAVTKTDPLAKKLIVNYFAIRTALASDDADAAKKEAEKLVATLDKEIAAAKKDKRCDCYIGKLDGLKKAAEPLTDKKLDIEVVRDKFAVLSDGFISYVGFGIAPADLKAYQLFYCGMAKHYWIQKSDQKIGNPYYGKAMPDCGEKKAFTSAKDIKHPDGGKEQCKHGKMDEKNMDKKNQEHSLPDKSK